MRYPSIDVLRTLAIAMMVVVHFTENLSAWYGAQGNAGLSVNAFWRPTGLAAPLFTFLSGVSYRLWIRGREARGDDDGVITKSTVRRGLFLLGLGFAFNVLVWLPEDTFNWDVLTFIGAAFLLLATCRDAPAGVILLMAAVAVVVSPALRHAADYASSWTTGYYDPDVTLGDVLLGFLCCGYFPIFPWIAYPLMGFAAAPAVLPAVGRPPSAWPGRLGVALVLVAAAALAARTAGWETLGGLRLPGWTMFPATTTYVCGTLGLALVLLPIAHRMFDGSPGTGWLARVAGTYSRHSLSLYVLHHVVHVWPLWIWGAWTADDVTARWQMALPASAALGLAAAFLAAVYPLLRWMDATGRRGIEEWMRWLCD